MGACLGFFMIDLSLLDIENQNCVVTVTIKNSCCYRFAFSHLV